MTDDWMGRSDSWESLPPFGLSGRFIRSSTERMRPAARLGARVVIRNTDAHRLEAGARCSFAKCVKVAVPGMSRAHRHARKEGTHVGDHPEASRGMFCGELGRVPSHSVERGGLRGGF